MIVLDEVLRVFHSNSLCNDRTASFLSFHLRVEKVSRETKGWNLDREKHFKVGMASPLLTEVNSFSRYGLNLSCNRFPGSTQDDRFLGIHRNLDVGLNVS